MSLYNNIHGYYDSTYTQKMLNAFPLWSRSRLAKESVAQRLISCFGMYLEDTARNLRRAHDNRYISTCSTFLNGIYYTTEIPRNFLFEYKGYGNDITYIAPIVTASTADQDIVLEIVNDLEDLERSLPTRVDVASTAYEVADVVSPTVVTNLGSATIGDVVYPNWIFIRVSGGTNYGTTDDPRFFYPANIALTGLLSKDTEKTEGRIIYSDDIVRTWNRFADITEVTADNLDSSATIRIDSWGFNQEYLLERAVTYSNIAGTHNLYYSLSSDAYGSLLNYNIGETANIQLLRQGYSNLVTQESAYLLDTLGAQVSVVDIAQMDMSDWLFAVSSSKLYVYDTYIPAIQNTTVLKETKRRTIDVHLGLETSSDRRNFSLGEAFTLQTVQKAPLSRFSKPVRVRLYSIDEAGAQVYYDSNGNSVSVGDAWQYNDLYYRGTGTWRNKKWNVTLTSVGEYAFTLETEYLRAVDHPTSGQNQNKTEYDVIPLQVLTKTALKEFSLPSTVQPVTGVTVDYDSNIWIRSGYGGLDRAFKLDLHYDYCLIDYRNYRMYFREPYVQVKSLVSNGLPVWNPATV